MMNLELSPNLTTEEFIKMYQCVAKTPLEVALFSRLNDLVDYEHDYGVLYDEHEKLKEESEQ